MWIKVAVLLTDYSLKEKEVKVTRYKRAETDYRAQLGFGSFCAVWAL